MGSDFYFFWWGIFAIFFEERNFENGFRVKKILCFFWSRISQKISKKNLTISFNMKILLRFFSLIFFTSPNLAKYIFWMIVTRVARSHS
jgi:hypothetical protein